MHTNMMYVHDTACQSVTALALLSVLYMQE